MNEKSYKKRLDFQQKMISRQLEQIETLKSENEKLMLKIEEKDRIINSVASLKEELVKSVSEAKGYKEECKELNNELKKMKEILNQTVYKGKWRLVKFLIK